MVHPDDRLGRYAPPDTGTPGVAPDELGLAVWFTDPGLRVTAVDIEAAHPLRPDLEAVVGASVGKTDESSFLSVPAVVSAHEGAVAGERVVFSFAREDQRFEGVAAPLPGGAGVVGLAFDVSDRNRLEVAPETTGARFGTTTGPTGTGTDTTARPRSEEAVGEAEKRYQAIFETGAEGIWVTDPDWRLLTINPAGARILGYASMDAATSEIGDARKLYVDPERRDELARRIEVEGEVHAFEADLCRRDGTTVSTSMNVGPVRDERGAVVALVHMAADITERMHVEEALRAKEGRQATLAELGREALGGGDLDQLFQLTCRRLAQILEVDVSEILELEPGGNRLLLRGGAGWPPGTAGAATVPLGPHSQAGYTLYVNEPVITEDVSLEDRFVFCPLGVENELVSGMTTVIGDPEEPFGVLGVHARTTRSFTEDDVRFLSAVADVLRIAIARFRTEALMRSALEELRKANQEARYAREAAEAQRLRASLFSSITHDLRTPLTGITLAASTLAADRQIEDSTRRSLASSIEREAQRLSRLVGNVLSLSKARADVMTLDRQPAALEEIIESVVSRLSPVLERHRVALDLSDDLPEAVVDITQFDQALSNVLENAAAYSPAGTEIRVLTRRSEKTVQVRVEDEGPGIPVSERSRVLEPFIRGREEAGTGSGLGLAIARAVMEGHGGGVRIEDAPSRGTAVVLELPVDG